MPESAISTRDLGRRYGRRWVVQELDLEVPRGSVFGYLGLNGAGKSTTIRMLLGLIRRHSGRAAVLGMDPARDEVAVKERVGYVAEQPAFYEWMTVDEVCGFVAHYRKGRWQPQRATDLLARFKLQREARLSELSKGQRAKVALVLALTHEPDLLILDEPTTGLDPVARRDFVEGILSDYQTPERTIFISSHLVNEISGLVDQVGILHEGRLIHAGRAEEFTASIRRVRMSFADSAPTALACSGLLKYKADGRDAVVVVRNYDDTKTPAELKSGCNPQSLEVESLNLEDAFVEFISAAEGGRL